MKGLPAYFTSVETVLGISQKHQIQKVKFIPSAIPYADLFSGVANFNFYASFLEKA